MAFNVQEAVDAAIAAAVAAALAADAATDEVAIAAIRAEAAAQIQAALAADAAADAAAFAAKDAEIAAKNTQIATLQARIAELEAGNPPSPPPPPPPPPPVTGFPSASTTGVPAGTTLTNAGFLNITVDGTVVENRNITWMVINARNVTVRKCQINGQVNVLGGSNGRSLNVKFEDCTFTRATNDKGGKGIYFDFQHVTAGETWVKRCKFTNVEDGIYLEATNVLIEGSYFGSFGSSSNSDPHHDGIQLNRGNDITIRGNNLDLGTNFISSCINMPSASNILIEGNRINGGAYSVRIADQPSAVATNVRVLNNTFLNKQFGYIDVTGQAPGLVISGNVDTNGNVVS